MRKIDKDKINVRVGQKVGEFEMSYGPSNDDNLPFSNGFRVISLNSEDGKFGQMLEPGQFHPDRKFYQVPITCFYVQIASIKKLMQGNAYKGDVLQAHLKVHSKNMLDSRDIYLDIVDRGDIPLGFMYLSYLINLINKYVDSKREISRLDVDKLTSDISGFRKSFDIYALLLELKIEFYSDSRSRIGKDNYFWTDAVVSGIYENSHFRSLIISFFKSHYNSCEFIDGVLTSCIESDYGYAASRQREKFENAALDVEVRSRIALWIGEQFSYEEYLLCEFENSKEGV